MRAILTILLLGAALWRAGADWLATVSQGYAYRFGTLGSMISGYWPEDYANLVESLQRSGVPFAWNPVGAIVMSLPLALLLLAIGGAVWVTRARPDALRPGKRRPRGARGPRSAGLRSDAARLTEGKEGKAGISRRILSGLLAAFLVFPRCCAGPWSCPIGFCQYESRCGARAAVAHPGGHGWDGLQRAAWTRWWMKRSFSMAGG